MFLGNCQPQTGLTFLSKAGVTLCEILLLPLSTDLKSLWFAISYRLSSYNLFTVLMVGRLDGYCRSDSKWVDGWVWWDGFTEWEVICFSYDRKQERMFLFLSLRVSRSASISLMKVWYYISKNFIQIYRFDLIFTNRQLFEFANYIYNLIIS